MQISYCDIKKTPVNRNSGINWNQLKTTGGKMCSNKEKIDELILVFVTNVQKLHIAICDNEN